jgi:hypothetical protein
VDVTIILVSLSLNNSFAHCSVRILFLGFVLIRG